MFIMELKSLLNQMRVEVKVRSYLVFINPSFMLYGAIPHLSMIFPMQIQRFLKKVNSNTSSLTDHTFRLAQTLAQRRKCRSAYEQLPEYELAELKKGVFCKYCSTKLLRKKRLYFICNYCKKSWTLEEVLLSAIAQFNLLFPDLNVKTNKIYEWCNRELSMTYIRNTMKHYFKTIQNGSYTYYELPDNFSINNLSRLAKNI